MIKVLVIDDEQRLLLLVRNGLTGFGFEVIVATNATDGLTAAAQQQPEVIILDVSLGRAPNGIELCRHIREFSSAYILMLSAMSEERDKVTALDAGADDYLTKPFGMEELRARIQAGLRRTASTASEIQPDVRVGDLHIDFVQRRVFVAGDEVHLTPKEYDLLRLLAMNAGRVMTHQYLLTSVWGREYSDADHYIRVFINQIRKKLREDGTRNIRYILNEPGVGYRFIPLDTPEVGSTQGMES